jgi:hypothetical protein
MSSVWDKAILARVDRRDSLYPANHLDLEISTGNIRILVRIPADDLFWSSGNH